MTYFPPNAPSEAAAADGVEQPPTEPRLSVRQRFGAFWLKALFWSVHHVPSLTRLTVDFWIAGAWLCSPALRRNTLVNARRILGEEATPRDVRRLARRMLRSNFIFVYDVGRHASMTVEQMRQGVESVEGIAHYDEARRCGRGVILATAHFGAFENAVAALLQREPRIHVVFQRDRFGAFETVRTRLHQRLGLMEIPIDEGISAWAKVRDALERNEAVLMQADRTMPGQRGIKLPFLNSHMEMPIGPAKLARMTGAPMVPVFAVRLPNGKVRIEIQPAIFVDAHADANPLEPAVRQLAAVIERYVRLYPEQWLILHQPWCDAEPAT